MYRVLVIDDDSSVRIAIRFLLEYLHCLVDEAEDGQRGLESAQQNHPDLILCDLAMPVMDGFECLRRLRNDPVLHGVPVIAVSALLSKEIDDRVMLLGANAVLMKPFSFADLTRLVRNHLPGTQPTGEQIPPPD